MSAEVVTTRSAANLLCIGERQVRRLINAKVLEVIGIGNGRRITLESIEGYRQRKTDTSHAMSFPMSAPSEDDRTMQKLIRTLPPLSSPQSAARRLGIPAMEMQGMVSNGAVPSIRIGLSPFVPRVWLASMLSRADGIGTQGKAK